MRSISESISTSSRCSGCDMAGLDRARQGGGRAGGRRRATPMHAENEKPGEEQIAHDRVKEKHPARRGAVLRQTDGDRLDEAGEIFGITGIAQPGERVRDDVEQDIDGERSGQVGFPRSVWRPWLAKLDD